MKRSVILGALVSVGVLTAVVGPVVGAAQQPAQPAPRVVTVEKLKDNLYMLGGMGGGGNAAVLIGATSVTVVDTKNPGWGQPILEAIRTITDKPVSRIINTHAHADHTSGNVEFPANVEVVTQASSAVNMQNMVSSTGVKSEIFKEHGGRGLPTRTFTDRLTLGRGADQIDLYYFGRGHTNGDAWVVFPEARVMHAGDIFSGKNLPTLDANNSGSGVAIGDTLAKAHAATAKSVDRIITGHSTVMTPADLLQYAEFNKEFLAAVQAGKKAGQTVEQIVAGWKMPARYTGYAEPAPMRLLSNVRITYDEIR